MLKTPIPMQQIVVLLKAHYGIDIHTAQLIPAGADMDAFVYRADSTSNSYFVKLKYGHHDEINLSIISLLHDSGIGEIIFPIRTLEAQLFQQFEDFKLIVYPFINAANGFTQNLTEEQWILLGKVLRKVHEISVPTLMQQQLRKEEYSTKWRDMLRSFYNQMEIDTSDDNITTDFKSFFSQNAALIRQIVDSAEELSKKIKPDLDNYVLCHSDIHAGNVMVVNEESIFIVDWDEPMLAPKERDLMFIGGGVGNVWNKPYETRCFYEGYGRASIDEMMLSYYRHERIIEDMALYTQYLLLSDQNNPSKIESFKYFKAMFEPNDVIEMAVASCTSS